MQSLLNAPPPKFNLWDKVYLEYSDDDTEDLENYGKRYRVFGVVVGMVYDPEYMSKHLRGWVYFVLSNKPTSLMDTWPSEPVHEQELQLVSNLPSGSLRDYFGEVELPVSNQYPASIQTNDFEAKNIMQSKENFLNECVQSESARLRELASRCFATRKRLKYLKSFYNRQIQQLQANFKEDLEALRTELKELEYQGHRQASFLEQKNDRPDEAVQQSVEQC